LTITLDEAGDRPHIVITVPADLGAPDLVYPYEPVAAPATPSP
jgi:hypothetical protein